MTPMQIHARQFKEMLQITKALPAGNWSKPLEVLELEGFYMMFHKNNRNKFVTVGRKPIPTCSSWPLSFLKPSS